MSRATAWLEAAGIPAVGIVCKGFTTTVRMTARFEGLTSVRLVEYPPPNIAVHSAAEVYENALRLVDDVTAALTAPVSEAVEPHTDATPSARSDSGPKHREIVFCGDLD